MEVLLNGESIVVHVMVHEKQDYFPQLRIPVFQRPVPAFFLSRSDFLAVSMQLATHPEDGQVVGSCREGDAVQRHICVPKIRHLFYLVIFRFSSPTTDLFGAPQEGSLLLEEVN
ncbi:hypothetical protein TGME49_297395 [Toxoplasma gondii ME49]|uniref:Uncharacterized protein n=3 Tax=Toxoplasma gondii TaxID=5811 RepID=A0A2G8XVH9_TOXGO|nr:hypothetical protein TGME49_297395 [Toxoplasma gondii ME49]EPT32158.1 hypothetical protein TGME49_297395 [Toxoplasma gondii ME49]KYF42460.1 hypothetical protein TGARI_297395 [Toxoplasma gondii ARI]PIL99030.1 hypothetical protein TGCOUG_297395 [Toxoplasma gondii COUG]|eukprot:XP_018638357.1 hypothetical protein TGME49_297395 [Toxoplasma gondii ME49]